MSKYLLTLAAACIAFGIACTDAARPIAISNASPSPRPNAAAPARTLPPHDDHADDGHDAPRITLANAKKEFDAGSAVFVDVRSEAAFNHARVKGALNITPTTLDTMANKIPKGKKIIVYCS